MSQVVNYLLDRPQDGSGSTEEMVFWVDCAYASKESSSLLGRKCCDWDCVVTVSAGVHKKETDNFNVT